LQKHAAGTLYKSTKVQCAYQNVQLAKRQVKQVSLSHSSERISGGRLFQARAAATENARSPSVVRRVDRSCRDNQRKTRCCRSRM